MTRTSPAPILTPEAIASLKLEGMVVLAGGAFDILHPGHIEYIEEAAKLGDTLVVHVPGDERVREKKGPTRPIVAEEDRARIVAALKGVDYVVIYNGRQFDEALLDAVRPQVYYMSEAGNPEHVKEIETALAEFGGDIFVSQLPKVTSTSDIIMRIRSIDN